MARGSPFLLSSGRHSKQAGNEGNLPGDVSFAHLCWLLPSVRRILLPLLRMMRKVPFSSLPRRGIALGTSVQEIGMVHAIERASLPKHVRGDW